MDERAAIQRRKRLRPRLVMRPPKTAKMQLLKDRYVDDKGAPLDAEAKQPYSEFKMMPISMKLHMDQRKISKLLVDMRQSVRCPSKFGGYVFGAVASELLDAANNGSRKPDRLRQRIIVAGTGDAARLRPEPTRRRRRR